MRQDQEELARILERREFQRYASGSEDAEGSWLSRLLKGLWELLERKFPEAAISPGALDVVSWAIIGAVLLALGAMVVWLVRNYAYSARLRRTVAFTGEERSRSYRHYMNKADLHAEAGQLRESVRCMVLAFLLYAGEMDWVRLEAWKTNGEYAAELRRRRSEALPLFKEGAELFDRVWYGGEPSDPELCRRWRERLHRLIEGGTPDGQPG